MTRYTYLLIIWTIAACCALTTRAEAPESRYADSKHIPTCLEKRCKEPLRNSLMLLTGPPPVGLPGARTLMGIGYFRQLRYDLDFGVLGIGTDQGFVGWMLGIGARF